MSQITPTLWLSGIDAAYSKTFLVSNRITHVLNCAEDAPMGSYPLDLSLNLEQVPMEDDEYPRFLEHLHEAVMTLDAWQTEGRTVLVHCRAGISRSPTVVLAWMILCKRVSLEDAWAAVSKERYFVRPNDYFMSVLKTLRPGFDGGC